MQSTATFSGVFKKVSTGSPDKNISYNGSVKSTNGKYSFDVETNVNGVVKQLARKGVSLEQMKMDPEILTFMSGLTKRAKPKQKKSRKASR
jgi:hypothetical protein